MQGLFPPRAAEDLLAIAWVWVDCNADEAELVYANNNAAYTAVQRALKAGWPSRDDLAESLTHIGNPFFTLKQAWSLLSSQ